MRFADELRGSDGEWCSVTSAIPGTTLPPRRAIIRAVHDDGRKVTVQFEDDNSCGVIHFTQVELEGHEDLTAGEHVHE